MLKKDKNESPEWLSKLPQMAKQLEVSLYRDAQSFQGYMDMKTLKNRLQVIAMEVSRKAKGQGSRDDRQKGYSTGSRPANREDPAMQSSSHSVTSPSYVNSSTGSRRQSSSSVQQEKSPPSLSLPSISDSPDDEMSGNSPGNDSQAMGDTKPPVLLQAPCEEALHQEEMTTSPTSLTSLVQPSDCPKVAPKSTLTMLNEEQLEKYPPSLPQPNISDSPDDEMFACNSPAVLGSEPALRSTSEIQKTVQLKTVQEPDTGINASTRIAKFSAGVKNLFSSLSTKGSYSSTSWKEGGLATMTKHQVAPVNREATTTLAVNGDLATELYRHIQEENWAMVENLLVQYPELAETADAKSGELPLHMIARHTGAWTLLIDMVLVVYPKALMHRDKMGALPIHLAALHNNLSALEIIYNAYNEGISTTDRMGRMPIHVAAEFDAVDTVKFLLSKFPEGASFFLYLPPYNSGGGLPLHIACRNCASFGVITALLAENFASAEKADVNGDLPLHLLLRCGKVVDQIVVEALLAFFPSAASRTDMHGDLPLAIAVKHQCPSTVINTVLKNFPDAAGVLNDDGHCPLFLAFKDNTDDRTIAGLLNHAPEVSLCFAPSNPSTGRSAAPSRLILVMFLLQLATGVVPGKVEEMVDLCRDSGGGHDHGENDGEPTATEHSEVASSSLSTSAEPLVLHQASGEEAQLDEKMNDVGESNACIAPVATKELRWLPGWLLLLMFFSTAIALEAVIPRSCRVRMLVIQFLEFIEKPMFRTMFYIWAIVKLCPFASIFIFVSVCGYQCWQAKRQR